jgi:hypothetical protein
MRPIRTRAPEKNPRSVAQDNDGGGHRDDRGLGDERAEGQESQISCFVCVSMAA